MIVSDAIDNIILTDLKSQYTYINRVNKIDCSDYIIDIDHELLKAFDKVIEYYSTKEQYKEWKLNNESSDSR